MDVSCEFKQSAECVTTGRFDAREGVRTCQMLNWLRLEARFLVDESGLEIVEIPCTSKSSGGQGDPISQVLIMPKAGEMGFLKSGISEARLFELLAKLESGTIELSVPALEGITDRLPVLGAGEQSQISSLVHQVRLYLSDAGAQAQYASAVCCLACVSPPKPRFVFDRPFVSLFVDRRRAAVLFAAVVESADLLRLR